MTNFFFAVCFLFLWYCVMCVIAAKYIVIVVGIIVALIFVVLLLAVIGLLVKKFKSRKQNSHDQSTLSAIDEPNLADGQVASSYDHIAGGAVPAFDPPAYPNECYGQASAAAAAGAELKDIQYEQLSYPYTEKNGKIYDVMPV